MSENPKRVLIHIGYHKTGTTWLQEALFDQHDYGFTSPWSRSQIVRDWVRPTAFAFDPCAARASYQVAVEKACAGGLVPVLSHERLSGYPASGGYDGRLIADRLVAVFPEARVLIVIREQKSMLRSWYAQYVRDGGSLSIRQYLNPVQPHIARVPSFNFEFYEYDRLIRYYHQLLSPEQVLVLPFEWLRQDPQAFARSIASFSGVPSPDLSIHNHMATKKNGGARVTEVAMLRLVNRAFSTNQLNPVSLVHAPRLASTSRKAVDLVKWITPERIHDRLEEQMKQYITRIVGDRYQESNRRTSELIGVNLIRFGY